MVLIRVDFPDPFGPRIATFSPFRINKLISSRAIRSSRATVTCDHSMNSCLDTILSQKVSYNTKHTSLSKRLQEKTKYEPSSFAGSIGAPLLTRPARTVRQHLC